MPNNRTLAEQGIVFRKACELAQVAPTQRQASKYHNRRGVAYQQLNRAKEELAKEAHKRGDNGV